MSKVLAMLSGKGGSGKTTLALSIASMLSSCNIKVLLVDCDLSTNGATYFYEAKLAEKTGKIGSFYDIFIESKDETYNLIKINDYMDFMPSITKITKENIQTYLFNKMDYNKVKYINESFKKKYDIIIYDCQAGYADLLKVLLPIVDLNLVVMEADAISSAAIRSFYLKIGDIINEKKIYQIFNKATDEEYEIYSKISGGTVFTNIETVIFDWKIRKAFSVSQIPDMDKTSARYGEQVYNICKVLFTEDSIQEKLKKIEIIIKINKKCEEENILKQKIIQQKEERKKKKNRVVMLAYSSLLPIFCALVIFVFLYIIEDSFYSFEKMFLLALSVATALSTIFVSGINMNDLTKERHIQYMEMNNSTKKLDEISEEKSILQKKLNQINDLGDSKTKLF